MRKNIFFGIFLTAMLVGGLFFWRAGFLQKERQVNIDLKQTIQTSSVETELSTDKIEVSENKPVQVKKTEKIKVPFTSQAPLGDWSDERFQNGCEEASVAMAMKWIKNETFSSPSDAQQEIINIAKFEEKTLGNSVDATVEDVGKILSQFYGFENFTISRNVTLNDLKTELEKGNIILVPAFGRALKNPNYTQPGPITHMLVLVGYDAVTKEFITNDPGTKRGEGYRYDENILFDAIWSYPAGKIHPNPPKSTKEKAMITIER